MMHSCFLDASLVVTILPPGSNEEVRLVFMEHMTSNVSSPLPSTHYMITETHCSRMLYVDLIIAVA